MKTSLTLPMMFLSMPLFSVNSVSIEEAVKRNLISATIIGNGGHTGDVIKVRLKNNKGQPITCSVEAGRRLDSQDESEQDILITKPLTLALLPNQTKTFRISGMCCQASNSSPDSGAVFSVGEMADANLIKMARFIDENKWHTNDVAQSAVWVVSDNNPIEDIGGDDPVSKKLQEFVSKLTGKPIPKYKVEYVPSDNGMAYSGVAARIKGTIEYEMTTNAPVTFGIYDSRGHAVQMFFVEVPRNKGSYVFNYEFRTAHLPKGDYFAKLRVDGQVRKEEKFSF